jgi:hypothetical protein
MLIGGVSSQAQGKSKGSTAKSRARMIMRVLGSKIKSTLISLFGLLEEERKLPIVQAVLAQFVDKQQKANGPVLVAPKEPKANGPVLVRKVT